MKIESTTQYDQFKTLRGNREVVASGNYLRRLIRSIQEENLLDSNPIVVNSRMEVIDGQHRLAAARWLKEPIYYVVSAQADLADVHRMNATRKAWTAEDYARSYAELGRTEYLSLLSFSERNGITIANSLVILAGEEVQGKIKTSRFYRGEFKGGDWPLAEKVAQLRAEILPFCAPSVFNSKAFHRALKAYMVAPKDFPAGKLVEKLGQRKEKIQFDSSILGYMRQFEDALNYHIGDDRHVRIY